MRRSIIAWIIACCLALPACGVLPENGDTSGSENSAIGVEHVDQDANGLCDDCGEKVAITFDFFALNDLHGKFDDTAAQEGVDEMTTYLKNAKADNENTIILSSGDMWQGSPESNITKGAIITEWMNDVGFASMTMGNHEYDWGEEYIVENAELAQFPFLGINVFDRDTNRIVEYCQPSVTVEKNGVKIGIIGAIGDCYSSISGEVREGFYFKTGSELTSLVKAEANKLRAEGADFIVYSLHGDSRDGSAEYDTSLSDGYVDLVFEGHSHQSYAQRDSKGVYHVQNKGDNGGISHVELTINYVNDTATVLSAQSLSPSAYTANEDDPIVDTLLEKYATEIAVAKRELGQNDKIRRTDEVLSLCAKLYFEAGYQRWGTQYDLVLGGGFMSMRAPYELHAGKIVYGDLMNILPFDNQLVLCSVKGRDLRANFLETENTRYYIHCGEYGESVKNNIQDDETYYLVTDTYSSTFAPNRLTEIARYDEGVYARDLLAAYIEEGGLTTDLTQITVRTIAQIKELGSALPVGAQTAESYYVRGEVVSIQSTYYGNLTIKDESGNTLYIYGVWDLFGNRYGSMANPPKVGDTLLLGGVIKNYSGTIEMVDGIVYTVE